MIYFETRLLCGQVTTAWIWAPVEYISHVSRQLYFVFH